MTTCAQTVDALLDLELGELSDDERRDVTAHVAACPKCAAFARTYGVVPGLVERAVAQDELPDAELDDLVQGVLDRLHHERAAADVARSRLSRTLSEDEQRELDEAIAGTVRKHG